MNEPNEPLKDDIYSRESPLPGSGRPSRPASTVTGSNTHLINPLTDLVLPFILTHFIYWPVLLIGLSLFSGGGSVGFVSVSMLFATVSTSLGGAGYGWFIGRRFTNLTFISNESNRKDATRRGERNRILMSVFQAFLFPALLWGGCIAIAGMGGRF